MISLMAKRPSDPHLAGAQSRFGIQLVGGPTAILQYGGLRWLTDPTLSPPGEYGGLTKLTGPATAVHAQHGPDGSDEIQGPVLGFVLSAPGAEEIDVSADNASRDVVRRMVQKTGELPIAILNAGAVQLPKFDHAYLTLSADHAADVVKILGARVVIPLHFEGWAHCTQGAGELKAAFSGNGIADRLLMLERGQRVEV